MSACVGELCIQLAAHFALTKAEHRTQASKLHTSAYCGERIASMSVSRVADSEFGSSGSSRATTSANHTGARKRSKELAVRKRMVLNQLTIHWGQKGRQKGRHRHRHRHRHKEHMGVLPPSSERRISTLSGPRTSTSEVTSVSPWLCTVGHADMCVSVCGNKNQNQNKGRKKVQAP